MIFLWEEDYVKSGREGVLIIRNIAHAQVYSVLLRGCAKCLTEISHSQMLPSSGIPDVFCSGESVAAVNVNFSKNIHVAQFVKDGIQSQFLGDPSALLISCTKSEYKVFVCKSHISEQTVR